MSRLVTNLFGKALRETGQAMDRLALMINDTEFYKETYTRHRPVMDLYGKVCDVMIMNQFQECFFTNFTSNCSYLRHHHEKVPIKTTRISTIDQNTSIESEVFVAPSAAVIGEVSIKSKSSVTNVD